MPGKRLAIQALLWTIFLGAPIEGRAQGREADTEWQFLVRAADWDAILRLQDQVRDYRERGVIGRFEIRITQDGEGYDALVVATVIDAGKLARLRGLVVPEREPAWEPGALVPQAAGPPGEDGTARGPGLTPPRPSI
ncbi:MAG: hypothetical protein ACREMK_13415 [Gemmatimonadota bacterium]